MSCGNYSFRMKEKLVVKVEKLLLLILIFTNFFKFHFPSQTRFDPKRAN